MSHADKAPVCGHAHGRMTGTQPVFLSSVYRSGSTFMAGVLNCHPRLVAASSTVKFLRFCLERYDPLEENLDRLIRDTRRRLNVRWDLDFDADAIVAGLDHDNLTYAAVYDAIMRQVIPGADRDGVNWVEKIAVMWSRAADFLTMFPQGRVIHVFRDPRRITASYKAQTYEPGFTYLDAGFNFLHAMDTIEECRRVFGPDRVMLLKMESLSEAPERVLREVCAFLDVPFSEQMLRPEEYGRNLGEDWTTNTSFEGAVDGFAQASDHWRTHLTAAEIFFIEMITQPKFAGYGYESAGLVPSKDDWDEIYGFVSDPFLSTRFARWAQTGAGSEGYRTDPIKTEMEIVSGADRGDHG